MPSGQAQGNPPAAGGGESGGSVKITPTGDFRISAQDEFDPASLHPTYTLANGTSAPLSWFARSSQPWLTLDGPESGVLAPGESIEVPATVVLPDTASEDKATVAEVVFRDKASGTVLGTRVVTIDSGFETLGSSGGWTTFTPSTDTRTVYVSSSIGDDMNDGLSATRPKRTIAAGVTLLRHGFPDWLLLKRGDVWHESLGQWRKSGRGPDEPMVVWTYGSAPARPLLRTGTQPGIRTNGGAGSPATIDCLAVAGLHFQASSYTGGGDCFGAQMLQPGAHLLIEDCKFEGYGTNLVLQGFGGRLSDVSIRRSVVVDAYIVHAMTGAHAEGLYAYGVDGLLIEENVFDHNGWSETVPGAGADMFSHNIYIDNGNTGVRVRGNLIANGSSHGLQLRCGGSVVNNLFVRNSIALLVGGGNNPEPGGVSADVRGNVILDGKNIDASNPRGWGIVISNISSGSVSFNVVANNELGTQPTVLVLDGDDVGDTGPGVGVHDLSILGNIFYHWGGGMYVEGSTAQITNVEFSRNDLQNAQPWPLISHNVAATTGAIRAGENRFYNQVSPSNSWTEIANIPHTIDYWKAQVGDTSSVTERAIYAEPDRSLASYNGLQGGSPDLPAFLAESRLQSFTHWRPGYLASSANRYIRRGF